MSGGIQDETVSRLVARDTVPWYKKRNLTMLYLTMLPACLGVEMTSGYDSSMINGLQAVAGWQKYFNYPDGAILGVLSSAYSLGTIFSLPFVPFIADRLGRKMSIVFGSIIMVIGAILQTATQSIAMFIISCMLLGMGIPFAIVAASSLIGELSHPKERARLGSIFNASWHPGAVIAAGVTLGTFNRHDTWSWRIPSVLQLLPSAFQLIFIWWAPESPRWLVSKGRNEEALAILVKYHAEGDENSELAKAEFTMIEQTLEIEMVHVKRSRMEMVATSGMRKRILVASFLGLATQWSGNGLTSYYLSPILTSIGITDNHTKNIINLGLTCWGFVNATVFAFNSTKFPRRRIYLICTTSILFVFTGLTIASARFAITGGIAASRATIVMIFLYSPAYNIGFNALTYTFLVELFPYHARARGITIFQAWGRCAGFFNQFVNPIGLKSIAWKYYISYCVWIAVEVLFVFFFFPETHGKTLEELSFLYESDMAVEQRNRVAAKLGQNGAGNDNDSSDSKNPLVEHNV
ncbi:general substrate transporter [Thelephora ganbajun]|uniref:General substrate transporter n=1 Tax=Thelephora ganbajun TaxID=370292 RepID=A0ACB6ZG83_THEGA|nr:general substrate transporter [Thelephora ganbajun]